jgi:hypothetical protein
MWLFLKNGFSSSSSIIWKVQPLNKDILLLSWCDHNYGPNNDSFSLLLEFYYSSVNQMQELLWEL